MRDKMYSTVNFLENDNMTSRIVVLALDIEYIQKPIGWKQKDFVVHMKNTFIGLTARLDIIHNCL